MRALRWGFAGLAAALTLGAAAGAVPAQRIVRGGELERRAEATAQAVVRGSGRMLVAAGEPADQVIPVGRLELTTAPPAVNAGFVAVPVRIGVDGKVVRTIYCGFHVVAFVDATVAARDLNAGHVITADDVRVGRVPAAARSSAETDAVIGRRLVTAVARGAPVLYEQTALEQIVRAGEPAVLVVRDGPVALTADVVARSSAGLGESVAVFNPRTNKTLSGIVTGRNRVEVTLAGEDAAP
jgi:flagella basal body P-ring formation protein FlgA